jgi:hypothetical protein
MIGMTVPTRAILATAYVALAGFQPARADGLQPGLYRIEQTPVINGVPGPPRESTRCLSAEAVADLDKTFGPISRTTNSVCEQTEHDASAQRLKWRLQCAGQLDMDVTAEFLFGSDRYVATLNSEASMGGQVMQRSRVTIAAQRVDDCQ